MNACTNCEALECRAMLLYQQTKEQIVIKPAHNQLELQTKNHNLFTGRMHTLCL